MRESHFVIQDSLKNGLVPETFWPIGAPYMSQMTNARPTHAGARRYETISQPFTATVGHPFPHLFYGINDTLLFGETSLNSVNTSTWALTPITTYNMDSWLSTKAIVAGGPWHVLDFGPTWLALNGSCMVCTTAYSPKVFVSDAVTVQTGCVLNESRAFMAGFDDSDFWRSAWQTFWEGYLDNIPAEIDAMIDFSAGADTNWVWWSTIGAGDLLWLWDPVLMVYGSYAMSPEMGYSESNPYILDLLRRNEMGLAPMPFRGTIRRVLPLLGRVLVYGSEGTAELRPISQHVPTMAVDDIRGLEHGTGVAGRGCVGGTRDRHVFIDNESNLWSIAPGEYGYLYAQKLGYSSYLSELDHDLTTISVDPQEKEFWISDGDTTYVLTPTGLGGPMETHPTSLARHNGDLIGPRSTDGNIVTEMTLKTFPFDVGERDFKHCSTVQMLARDLQAPKGRMHYRSTQGDYAASPLKPYNLQHVLFPNVSFVDGQLETTAVATGSDSMIHKQEIRYHSEGRRYRRGTKGVPETN